VGKPDGTQVSRQDQRLLAESIGLVLEVVTDEKLNIGKELVNLRNLHFALLLLPLDLQVKMRLRRWKLETRSCGHEISAKPQGRL
jgi:hypothetical protein